MVSPSRNQSGGGKNTIVVVAEDDKECMEQVGGDDEEIIQEKEEETDDDGDDDEVTRRRKRRRYPRYMRNISLTEFLEIRREVTGNPNLFKEDVLKHIKDYNQKIIDRVNNNIPHEEINRPDIPCITAEEAKCYLAAKRARSRSHPVFRCIITGLVPTIDTKDLVEAFSPFGGVIDSKVLKERHTERSKEFGYVAYSSEASALAAVEAMNGQDLKGRTITVIKARSTS